MSRLLSPEAAATATLFDFRRPPRVPKARKVAIDGVYERFAQTLQALFSARLRRPTDVVVKRVEQQLFGDFVSSLPDPCAAFVFDVGTETAGTGVLYFENALAFLLIDRLFGGPGDSADLGRSLTRLERRAITYLTERMYIHLRDAWEEHLEIRPHQIGFEAIPDTLQIVSREESVLVAELEIRSGAASGMISVCLPLHVLESFLQDKATRHVLAVPTGAGEAGVRGSLAGAVRNVGVPLTVRFPAFLLGAAELAGLRPGRIIRSAQPTDAPLEVRIAGQLRFLGTLGQTSGALGLRVTHLFHEAPSESMLRAPRGRIQ